MSSSEPALKAYTQYGSDAEKTYKARRFSIRQRLPHLTASQLQKRVSDLDEEIADLKNKNAQFTAWIRQVKREGSVEAYFDDMHRTLDNHTLGMLEVRLDANKKALKWMRREQRIYAWALRLRRAKGLIKLPFLRLQQQGLEKRLGELQAEIEAAEAKLQALRGDHEKVQRELYGVSREIELLSV